MSEQSPETVKIAPINTVDGVDLPSGTYGTAETLRGDRRVLYPTLDQWYAVGSQMLSDGWNMCLDLTAVDYEAYEAPRDLPAGITPERFEVVATFISHERGKRIQMRVQVPESGPVVPSLYRVFPGIDYAEREVYDLFGILFEGHPDLSRILMPETWQGHPLRKDYAIGGIPVQFKAPRAKAGDIKVDTPDDDEAEWEADGDEDLGDEPDQNELEAL